jgi:bacteriocin-like protein
MAGGTMINLVETDKVSDLKVLSDDELNEIAGGSSGFNFGWLNEFSAAIHVAQFFSQVPQL